jgi:hypothetical protein
MGENMKQDKDIRLRKLIRRLGSRNEVEVMTAARALAGQLQAIGKDLQAVQTYPCSGRKKRPSDRCDRSTQSLSITALATMPSIPTYSVIWASLRRPRSLTTDR